MMCMLALCTVFATAGGASGTSVDSTGAAFDFTHFETTLMPQWIASMNSGDGDGEYSWLPSRLRTNGENTSIYGTTDMVYAFFATGLLDALTLAEKKRWAGQC